MRIKEVWIYFHRDFDGMVSAALIADYISNEWPQVRIKFCPKGYGGKPQWETSSLKGDISFVLDYVFHPQATYWFDHHQTGLGNYKGPLDPQRHFWDPQKGSCALLIWEKLYEVFGYRNLNFSDLVQWADKIDSASYQLEEIVECQQNAFKIHLSLAVEGDNPYLIELTRLFWQYKDHLLSSSSLPLIAEWRFKRALKIRKEALQEFAKESQFDPETKIVFFQMLQSFFTCRFAPYYFYPEALYALGIIKITPHRYMVLVTENPWHKSNLINLGQMCKTLGGGGHPGVGAVTVTDPLLAQQIANTIAEHLAAIITSCDKD